MHLNLAILRIDFPEYSRYGQKVSQLFTEWLDTSAAKKENTYTLTEYNARERNYNPEDLDKYDGIIIPGSHKGAYEKDEWILQLQKDIIYLFENKNIPIYGVCFGHQILMHSLGGKVEKSSHPFQIGRRPFWMTSEMFDHFSCFTDAFLSKKDDDNSSTNESDTATHITQQYARYSHGDQVVIPPGSGIGIGANVRLSYTSLGYSNTCLYNGFMVFNNSPKINKNINDNEEKRDTNSKKSDEILKKKNKNLPIIISVQSHPEYSTTIGDHHVAQNIISYSNKEVISKDQENMEIENLKKKCVFAEKMGIALFDFFCQHKLYKNKI